MKLSNWMSHVNPQSSFRNLILPGTHDSGAYFFNNNHLVFGRPTSFNFINYIPCLNRNRNFNQTIIDWSKTQDLDIYSQLMNGIRYFNFSISYLSTNQTIPLGEMIENIFNGYYITHTIYSIPLAVVLYDLKKFIEENPTEIIVVNMSKYYITNELFDLFLNHFVFYFNDRLYKRTHNENVVLGTIKSLQDHRQNIILYSNGNINPEYTFNNTTIHGQWINTNNLETKVTGLIQQLNDYKKSQSRETAIYHLSWTLTPQTDDIKHGILRWLSCGLCYRKQTPKNLLEMADKINDHFRNFVQKSENISLLKAVTNSITFDYMTPENIERVINLNF